MEMHQKIFSNLLGKLSRNQVGSLKAFFIKHNQWQILLYSKATLASKIQKMKNTKYERNFSSIFSVMLEIPAAPVTLKIII